MGGFGSVTGGGLRLHMWRWRGVLIGSESCTGSDIQQIADEVWDGESSYCIAPMATCGSESMLHFAFSA